MSPFREAEKFRLLATAEFLRTAVEKFGEAWRDSNGSDRWSEAVGDIHLPAVERHAQRILLAIDRIEW